MTLDQQWSLLYQFWVALTHLQIVKGQGLGGYVLVHQKQGKSYKWVKVKYSPKLLSILIIKYYIVLIKEYHIQNVHRMH